MQRTLTHIYRTFTSHFTGLDGNRSALAAAVRECCANHLEREWCAKRLETRPFSVEGHTLQWITADYRFGDEFTDHPEDHTRRVLRIDGKLVDEPPPTTSPNPIDPSAPLPPGHWYYGGMWETHEMLSAVVARGGIPSLRPDPLPLCDLDALRTVARGLPRVMTIWFALHLSTLEPAELFSNLTHTDLRRMLTPSRSI